MKTPGKLELTIKITELPAAVTTTPNGWKEFLIDCDGREVRVTLRPKLFAKLEAAARDWPLWVAALSGKMGPATERGFELAEPSVQVFEKKPKAQPAPA